MEVLLASGKVAAEQRPHTSGCCSDALFLEEEFHDNWPVVAGERVIPIVTEMEWSQIEKAPNCQTPDMNPQPSPQHGILGHSETEGHVEHCCSMANTLEEWVANGIGGGS